MADSTIPSGSTFYAAALQKLVEEQLSLNIPVKTEKQQCGIEAKIAPVLLFSPHPDDESITGLLPLRLREEEGRRVVNVVLTLGTKAARKAARAEELAAACGILGFELERFKEGCEAPERLKLFGRKADPDPAGLVDAILAILMRHRPALAVYPHGRDGHPAHEGASRLLEHALRLYSKRGNPVAAIETECWQPLLRPNFVVEGSVSQVGRLCSAISCHEGEVRRNPYHVRQPIRMLGNSFRVAEAAGDFGSSAMPLSFCELYSLFRYQNGKKRRSRSLHFCPQSVGLSLDSLLTAAF